MDDNDILNSHYELPGLLPPEADDESQDEDEVDSPEARPKKRPRIRWSLPEAIEKAVTPDSEWYQALFAFLQYRHIHGPTSKPLITSPVEEERYIANWLKTQNSNLYKYNRGTACELTRLKVHALLQIKDFPWYRPRTEARQQMHTEFLQQLKEFKEKHGHCNVACRSGKLGDWLHRIRLQYKANTLEEDVIRQCEEIGVVWKKRQDDWANSYAHLKAYLEQHGHCNVQVTPDGEYKSLHRWVATQRTFYKENRLSEERFAKLEEIGFDWDRKGKRMVTAGGKVNPKFLVNLEKLKEYKAKHGNCNVVIRSNKELGVWIRHLRRQYRLGKMSQAKIDLLEGIDFAWSEWDYMFDRLKEYYEQHGNFNVRKKAGDPVRAGLKRWIANQRTLYESGNVSEEKIARMNEIGFLWEKPKVKEVAKPTSERHEEYIEQLRAYKEKHGRCNIPARSGKLGVFLHSCRARHRKGTLNADLTSKLVEIGVELDRIRPPSNPVQFAYQWNTNYEALKEFCEQNGHCNVKRGTAQMNTLTRWVYTQKVQYENGKLSDERISKLEALGFDWAIKPKMRESKRKRAEEDPLAALPVAKRWEELLKQLRAYKEKNGHANVPARSGKLGNFVRRCRTKNCEGTLNADLKSRLEEIGVELNPIRPTAAQLATRWDASYQQLKDFYEQHGHSQVPLVTQGPHNTLAMWCNVQRDKYNEGKLSTEQIIKLDAFAFDWETVTKHVRIPSTSDAELMEQLKAYKNKHGNCNVHYHEGGKLGRFVGELRKKYKDGTIANELKTELETMGFDWDRRQTLWDAKYKQLLAFYEENGHCNVPMIGDENIVLFNWVYLQKKKYRKGKMKKEQIDLLEDIEFNWEVPKQLTSPRKSRSPKKSRLSIPSTSDTELMEQLKAYKIKHGSCNVPYHEGGKLGRFVGELRKKYKDGTIANELKTELETMGFDWDPRQTLWDAKYKQLLAFYEENGHSNYPMIGDPLANWVYLQKKKYREGKMTKELIDLMENIEFKWEVKQQTFSTESFPSTSLKDSMVQLKAYKTVFGDCNVPHQRCKLGRFVGELRNKYKDGTLGNELKAELDMMGFDWEAKQQLPSSKKSRKSISSTSENESMEQLKAYKNKHGNCNVLYQEGKLGRFMAELRKKYKDGTIANELKTELETMGFDWDPRQTLWDAKYEQLLAFYEENGHCNVPKIGDENIALSNWVYLQKKHYRSGKMKKEQIDLLEDIEFNWEVKQQTFSKKSFKSHPERDDENKKLVAVKKAKKTEGDPAISHSEQARVHMEKLRAIRQSKRGQLQETEVSQTQEEMVQSQE